MFRELLVLCLAQPSLFPLLSHAPSLPRAPRSCLPHFPTSQRFHLAGSPTSCIIAVSIGAFVVAFFYSLVELAHLIRSQYRFFQCAPRVHLRSRWSYWPTGPASWYPSLLSLPSARTPNKYRRSTDRTRGLAAAAHSYRLPADVRAVEVDVMCIRTTRACAAMLGRRVQTEGE